MIFATTSILASSCNGFGHKGQATIPFDFHVGAIPMSAGTYEIQAGEDLLSFTNLSDHKHVDVVAASSKGHSGLPAKLLFHRYGTQYFLSETVNARGETEMTFLPSRTEMSVRMDSSNLWSRSQVLVAMK
jgi:hypothetical protein